MTSLFTNNIFIRRLLPCFVAAILIASFVSCHKEGKEQKPYAPPVGDTEVADTNANTATGLRFLALGDSYTIGQSVDSAERFPAQAAALLAQQGIVFSQIQYIATTGWTTFDLMRAIQAQRPAAPFDAVSLLIGVNDQFQSHDTTGYRERFRELLDTALSLSGNRRSHVFVLSIPDYGVTPYGGNRPEISEQIDWFNDINKSVTLSYGISYTDVTGISRRNEGNAAMLAGDGLHPSGSQYLQWSQALVPAMYEVLK